MDTVEKNLQQREKPELIAIITHVLRQEPDLEWVLRTPLPTASSRTAPIDPKDLPAADSGSDVSK
jgi:hypothetical protein